MGGLTGKMSGGGLRSVAWASVVTLVESTVQCDNTRHVYAYYPTNMPTDYARSPPRMAPITIKVMNYFF
eukprot:COSAG03_NODE_3349_length_2065_cov_4.387080_1_plen_68_part_10